MVAGFLTALAVGAVVGCVYDSSGQCGEGEVLYTDGVHVCVCAPGWIQTSEGCVQCGEHEVASQSGCVCESGYARETAEGACKECGENEVAGPNGCTCGDGYGRPDADSACVLCAEHEVTSSSGQCECEPGFARAAEGEACEAAASNSGGGECTSDDDCADGSRCDLKVSPTACRKAPTGLNAPCTSDADCADTEATYCDTVYTNSCLVQGCTLDPDNCYPGTECCDLSAYGLTQPLCVAEGACST